MSNGKDKKVHGKSKEKPSGFVKNPPIKIKAKKLEYVVVFDKAGNIPATYPVLEFKITNGVPNHLIDVQVARRYSNLLSGGPGLVDAWDKSKLPNDRLWQRAFSSWSNGEKTMRLDGSGKATYKMPVDWWKDLARIPRKKFVTTRMYYRVLIFPDATAKSIVYSIEDEKHDSAPFAKVHNNLVSFKVVDNGYINGGVTKSIRMEFTVREVNTTEMYTIVQWMQGYFRRWTGIGAPIYPSHILYNILHEANFPDRTVDRLRIDPRYWDGHYNISANRKTVSATDAPSQGSIVAPYTHFFSHINFETRVHLNFEVPAAVAITRQDGSPPTYGVVTGTIASPEPFILDSATWNTRVLEVRDAGGSINVSHPDTFAGP